MRARDGDRRIAPSFDAPMPGDPRLRRICQALLDDPGRQDDLDDLARRGALGRRTLTRLFRQQTGMSFAVWRQQVRLNTAIHRLTGGDSVTSVALDLGYDSPSAFTAMFRRVTGTTPRAFLNRGDEGAGLRPQ